MAYRAAAIPGSGPYTVSGGGTVSGGVVANDPVVTAAINYTNDLSQKMGTYAAAGTAISITRVDRLLPAPARSRPGVSVDGNAIGNFNVFKVGPVNFPNGVFTINGSATDQVLLDIGSSANLHGQILARRRNHRRPCTDQHVWRRLHGSHRRSHPGRPNQRT